MPSIMKLTTALLLAILSSLTTLAAASPVAVNELAARDEWQPTASTLTCLYLTTEPEWAGEGINLCEVGGTCSPKLPDGLAGNVSSAGPEPGVTCLVFSEKDCQGERSAPLVNPGYPDLQTVGFAKKAQSWECWKWCGWMGPSSASTSAGETSSGASGSSSMSASTMATTAPGLPPTTPSAPSSAAPTTKPPSSQAQVFETSMTDIVFTHTYADGSEETITSPLAVPVAATSASAPQNAGGAVSITATEGEATGEAPVPFATPGATESETLKGPSPWTTPGAASGVSITTTLSITDSAAASASEAGVEITTTQGVPSPVPTLTSEGVTVPVPTEVSPSASSISASSTLSAFATASSLEASSVGDEAQGWTSLVTLTGVDATLTVTATGAPTAAPTS